MVKPFRYVAHPMLLPQVLLVIALLWQSEARWQHSRFLSEDAVAEMGMKWGAAWIRLNVGRSVQEERFERKDQNRGSEVGEKTTRGGGKEKRRGVERAQLRYPLHFADPHKQTIWRKKSTQQRTESEYDPAGKIRESQSEVEREGGESVEGRTLSSSSGKL